MSASPAIVPMFLLLLIGGGLLGGLGTVLYLFLFRSRKEEAALAPHPVLSQCPGCTAALTVDNDFCPHCGLRVRT